MKKNYEIDGTWYHGGARTSIEQIAASKIDTELGGGELGQGFYVGNYGHEASAWARHVAEGKKPTVVELQVNNSRAASLKKHELSWLRAKEHAIAIAKADTRRTHIFNVDVVAAPIVGKNFKDTPTQLKWEGTKSAAFLNSSDVNKKITKL
ncbi:hypothetical protein HF908_08565 [Ralstonia pseudosolanacearum]|uniref:hypothetical protein n=1 Tax=Ralstonia pseudosolanacearum TaxID=1310165 RepID=UPI001866B082|nr:hypothetical protein [Ralstonia pseudosolanacearum]QOK91526.1 hypothetical protein HF908_08565 [Ralstonia pseudosolanacearum]